MRRQLLWLTRCLLCRHQPPLLFTRFCCFPLRTGLLTTSRGVHIAHVRCGTNIAADAAVGTVNVRYEGGLPVITVPLPSRREHCQFSLRPISDTVSVLCENISAEDKGIDFVALYSVDGTRIAGSTSIEHLLRFGSFRLRINDMLYDVSVPVLREEVQSLVEISSEKLSTIDDMKAVVASLHAVLNVNEFKVDRERKLIEKLEEVETELKPMEEVKSRIDVECEMHSERIMWGMFAAMGIQTGIFARLTWWEYSWDIMEPVTYFATYATVIASYGYYLYTRQSFEYPNMKNHVYSSYFHKRAAKYNFDVSRYNELQDISTAIRRDLERLRDPLYQNLPVSRLSWVWHSSKKKETKLSTETNEELET